jgi:succinate dehydrogenase / fumarate reductase cytochrome b subunit
VTNQASSSAGSPASWLERNYFLLRRLHSLSGVVPIGLFLIFHLTTNASSVWGAINTDKGATAVERGIATFQHEVNFIHDLPALILMEIFVLWLPIAFHSVLGVYFARTGKPNLDRYKYQDNVRYSLQRLSGYIGFLFILYHVATLRWGWTFLVPGKAEWSYAYASSTLAHVLQGSTSGMTAGGLIVSLFYFVGVTAMVFHFANGLWTAAITWGLTVSVRAQKQWGVVCAMLGAGLMALGWMAVVRFATLDADVALRVESKLMSEVLRQELQERGKLKKVPDLEHRDASSANPVK